MILKSIKRNDNSLILNNFKKMIQLKCIVHYQNLKMDKKHKKFIINFTINMQMENIKQKMQKFKFYFKLLK